MKTRHVLFALLTVPAFVYACGGDDSVVDDGGSDGTLDTGPGNDGSTNKDGTAKDTGTGNDTGTTNDSGGGDTGTTNDSGGSDGGTITDSGSQDSSFKCQKPSDCTNQFCCGSITFTGAGFQPNCTFVSASSQCASTCKSNIQFQCASTDTVRTCVAHADCADAGNGYTDCCNVPFGDASAEFCWSKSFTSLVTGMTCL